MYTIRLLFLLSALQFFSVLSFSQSFKKYNDPILNKTIITYHNVDAQIIFKKTISGNPSGETSPVYEIGLIRYDKSFGADDFMNSKAIVVFEDQSLLSLNDPVVSNYLYAGKHAISVRHVLTPEELKLFQTKNINFFRIYNGVHSLDKWQPEKIKNAALKIQEEEID